MFETFIITNKKEKYRNKSRLGRYHNAFVRGMNPCNNDFVCACCGLPVSVDVQMAAVNNRNHCPYCLASRHLDWREPGDRLSACKEVMHPVALTMKLSPKKYSRSGGELMVVHSCSGCGKVSANRLAADDDAEIVWQIFEKSLQTVPANYREIAFAGVNILSEVDRLAVSRQLFGIEFFG